MKPPVVIVAGDASLLDNIERVERDVFGECAYAREFLARLVYSPDVVVLVAMAGNRIAGYAAGSCSGARRGHIITIGVEKEFRGAGIGSNLMGELEEALRDRCGASTIYLEVKNSNKSAIRFYARRGYRVAAVLGGYYGTSGDGLLMLKKLA